MNLSILCVSRCQDYTKRFFTHFRALADILGAEFVLAHDRCATPDCAADKYLPVETRGAIEDVLTAAHMACSRDYVLRLDDDETLSPAAIMAVAQADLSGRVFAFPRANLVGDERTAVKSGHLFPDFQVRLMPKEAETRTRIHEGLPADACLPGMILHHKFLLKTVDERRAIAATYESRQPGCGTGHYLQFSVPEDAFESIETFRFVTGAVTA